MHGVFARGKTENEIMKEEPKPTGEPFNRVSSRRFSERVLKGKCNFYHWWAIPLFG